MSLSEGENDTFWSLGPVVRDMIVVVEEGAVTLTTALGATVPIPVVLVSLISSSTSLQEPNKDNQLTLFRIYSLTAERRKV